MLRSANGRHYPRCHGAVLSKAMGRTPIRSTRGNFVDWSDCKQYNYISSPVTHASYFALLFHRLAYTRNVSYPAILQAAALCMNTNAGQALDFIDREISRTKHHPQLIITALFARRPPLAAHRRRPCFARSPEARISPHSKVVGLGPSANAQQQALFTERTPQQEPKPLLPGSPSPAQSNNRPIQLYTRHEELLTCRPRDV
ncbi:hypothetical protein BU26DRAFT_72120 [Trematosphaeria pertusa]|uniref:Uncharacterized protein n=1 Tax=Trematosphaeria pertusa TaxID=390896 RepID=A0A6A6I531_9PLEO|nr:uncharacterized protein BU26DRAFT_72120 [Trematosphaeria pertusa]KAF2245625.1 hypothetical protein BU26DRAFT_72120 [Trematosphaeria pertusa]